jgi:uncharacterized repeat protein (TIGR01451 family)
MFKNIKDILKNNFLGFNSFSGPESKKKQKHLRLPFLLQLEDRITPATLILDSTSLLSQSSLLIPNVSTDLADYPPGSTAIISANHFLPGSDITFQVVHIIGPGADGKLGTLDDILGNNTGDGHEAWIVTDGGIGDFDGIANGLVQTSWYVNPDDSLNETFLLTAKGSGLDDILGTTDDQIATFSFTDAIPLADLAVNVRNLTSQLVPGANTTYTITVTNNGPTTVRSLTLIDSIPAGLLGATFGSPSSGSYDRNSGLWNGITLKTGKSLTINLTGTVSASATGSLTNSVTITAPSNVDDPNLSNNTASDVDTLTPQVDLSVSQSDGKTSIVPGNSNTYTITVTNNGPSTINNFTLNDAVPAGLLNPVFTPSSGLYNNASGLWDGLILASGNSVTLTLTGMVSPTATGSITNAISISAPSGVSETNSGNNSATDTNTLTPQVDLSVTQTDNKTSVTPGTSNTYTITVTNNGPSTISSFKLTDSVPAGLLNPVFTPSLGAYNSTTGLWSGLTLASGNSVTMTLTGRISPTATGSITNTVSVSPPSGVSDTNSSNNTATDTDTLTSLVDLSVSQTDNKTSVVPGTSNTYTITVTNNGPSTISNFTLTDSLPTALLNPVFTPSSGTYNSTTGLWNGLTLASGNSVTITLTGTIDPTATGSISNTVSVSPPSGLSDSNSSNNSATDTDTLTPQVDLSVSQTDNKTSIVPGTSNTYTITVTNNGPSTISSLTLTNAIPAGLLNPVFTPSSGTYNSSSGVWNGLTLASGNSVTITLEGTIDPTATGSISNIVSVSPPSGVSDTNSSNNTATDIDTLTPQVDLSVTQTDNKTSVTPGTSNTYTITVTNNGPSTINSFTLTDSIPAALLNATFGTPSSGSYNSSSGLWGGLNLASGNSVTITLSGTIDPTATGSISNTVSVSPLSGVSETNSANNSSTDTDTLTPQVDLSITQTDNKTSAVPGTSNAYSITVTNNGPSTINSFTMTDSVPAALLNATFGTPSSGSYNSASGLWNGFTLASGDNVTITLTGNIDPTATGSITNIVSVSAPSGVTEINSNNNSTTDVDTLTPEVDLFVSQSDNNSVVVPGTNTTYTITVINSGPSTINNFTLNDIIPASLLNATFGTPSSGSYNSITGIWSGITLASGDSVTITLTGTIDPTATGSFTNIVSVSPPSGVAETNSANNSADDINTLTPEVDLSVTQTDNKTSVVPGTSNTYTITVTNNGPSTISSFTLTDTVPAGLLNPVFTPSSGTYNSVSGLWNGLTLASGDSITITLTGTIDPTVTGSINNTVFISAPNGVTDTNSANDSSTDIDTLTTEVDLSVTQSDGKTSVIPGTTNTYSITVTNNGSSRATSVVVTDLLPDGVTSAIWTGSNGNSGTGELIDTIPTLASGESVTYQITFNIAGTATGSLINEVNVTSDNDTNTLNNTATDVNILTPQVDIGVTAGNNGNAVVPGTTSFYMITVTNFGPSTATNIKVSDLLPDSIKLPMWVGTNDSSGSGELKDTIATLDSGESVDYLLLLDIPEDLTGSIVNIVSVETDNDTDNLNNTTIDEDTLSPQVNINVKGSNDVNSLVPGTSTTYTITVTNSGPSTATNVKVSDLLPDGLLSAVWNGSNGSSGNGNLSDTIVSLASEESVTYSLTCIVSESLTGSVVNLINVSTDFETDPMDNTSVDEDILTPQVDVSVTQSDGKISVIPGTSNTYTITVNNAGPSTATNVTVSNLLPTGVISALWEGTNGSSGTGELADTITSLASGMSIAYLITFNISPSLTGSMINVVNISSDSDIESSNNSAMDEDTLTPQVDLSVSQTDGTTSAIAGTNTTYTITVTNNGPSTITNFTLTDVIPAGLLGATFGTPSFGAYDETSGVWNGLSLASGDSVTITLSGTIDPAYTGSVTNVVSVSPPSGVVDTNSANDSATDVNTSESEIDLSVSQTDNKTSIVPGTNTTYTITVTNNGPSTINSFLLNDLIPAGLLNASFGDPSSGNYDTITKIWNNLTLVSGDSVTITLTGTIDPTAIGSVTNIVSVSPPSGVTDTNSANNSATDIDTLTPEVDLGVTQTNGKTSVVPGTFNTYTITVTNNGPSTINGFLLNDVIPAGLLNATFGAPSSGNYDGSSGVWNGLNLSSGNSVTITLTGTISPNATGTITNAVSVSPLSGVSETNSANNSATDTNDLTPEVDLSVTQTDNKTSVVPGTFNAYTITVTNNGPSTISSLTLADVVPAGLLNPVFSPSSGTYNSVSGIWNGLNLASGNSVIITLTGTIAPTATGSITNAVSVSPLSGVSETNSANNSATDTNELTPQVDLVVTQTDNKTSAVPGTSNTYTITVTNNGPSTISSFTLNDIVPTGLLNPVFTPNSGTYNSVSGLWNGLTLASGNSVSITLTGTVDPSVTGSITNIVSVSPLSGVAEINSNNNSTTDFDTLTPQVDLVVTQTDNKTSVAPGTSTTYTITVTNNGPSTISSFTLTDAIPAGLLGATFGTPSLGSYNSASGVWSGLSFASSNSVTITLTGTIDPNATGTITNIVSVSPLSGVTETNSANNSATDIDVLGSIVDLSVTQTDGKTSAIPGTINTYTITVTNNGSTNIGSFTLIDVVPAQLLNATFGTPSSGTYNNVTGLWTNLNLASGKSVSMNLRGTVSPTATGTITNTVSVSPANGYVDSNTDNNFSTDVDTLTPQVDLVVTQTDGKTSVVPGTSTTYTITVTNNGPSTVSSFTMTDVIPAQLLNATFGTPSSGTYNNITGVWSGLSLGAGNSVRITLGGTIAPAATGSITNTVSVAAPNGVTDTKLSNNNASDINLLTPQADLVVTQTDGQTSVVPGNSNTYTITVTNNGPSTVVRFTLTDVIPASLLGATFGTPSSGSYNVSTGLWSGLNLTSGNSVTITLTGTISPTATGSITNTVTVKTPSGMTDLNTANNTSVDTDSLTPIASLSVMLADATKSVAPGTYNTYTVSITNKGPSTIKSLILNNIFSEWFLNPTFGMPSSGFYNSNTGLWNGLSLGAGKGISITIKGLISPKAMGDIINIAKIAPTSGVTDDTPNNNLAYDVNKLFKI